MADQAPHRLCMSTCTWRSQEQTLVEMMGASVATDGRLVREGSDLKIEEANLQALRSAYDFAQYLDTPANTQILDEALGTATMTVISRMAVFNQLSSDGSSTPYWDGGNSLVTCSASGPSVRRCMTPTLLDTVQRNSEQQGASDFQGIHTVWSLNAATKDDLVVVDTLLDETDGYTVQPGQDSMLAQINRMHGLTSAPAGTQGLMYVSADFSQEAYPRIGALYLA